ncbi:MAG TPA: hypothetical protein VM285_04620 [Polyangia bacterium]|nr:hypothetical protein [Polyangia bacterium]
MFSLFTKKRKVSDLQLDAEVTVEGRVAAPESVSVPGAGIRCACYFVLNEAWQHGTRGRGRKMWVPTGAHNKCGGFFLDDGTGRVWVAACEGNELDLAGGTGQVGELGKKGTGRYLARIVADGARVRVRGVVSRPKASEPGEGLVIRPGGKRRVLSIKHLRSG